MLDAWAATTKPGEAPGAAAVEQPQLPVAPMQRRLIEWYGEHARDLPWRRTEATAWGILVSEIMLQQTPVHRVLPAYAAWIKRWPTAAELAADTAAEAIRAWARLGYPRRALRLHACAITIATRYDNQVPSEVDQLLALPGIGSYTARAIAAFAFGQRQPVVDVNVRRVLARVVAGVAGCGPTTTAADMALMESLLPPAPARAARLCAAIMELGATMCTSRSPNCGSCPLTEHCAWRAKGYPAAQHGIRRTQRYEGTDRQVRGLLLAILRNAPGPVDKERLDAAWQLPEQRKRALTSLVDDGLIEQLGGDLYALAGQRTS